MFPALWISLSLAMKTRCWKWVLFSDNLQQHPAAATAVARRCAAHWKAISWKRGHSRFLVAWNTRKILFLHLTTFCILFWWCKDFKSMQEIEVPPSVFGGQKRAAGWVKLAVLSSNQKPSWDFSSLNIFVILASNRPKKLFNPYQGCVIMIFHQPENHLRSDFCLTIRTMSYAIGAKYH